MKHNKYIKLFLSILLTVWISYWVIFAWIWGWLISESWDTLTSAKWNELVNLVWTNTWKLNNVYNVWGSIGIGTTPGEKFEVAGGVKISNWIQIGNDSDTCNTSTKGTVRYNSTNKVMEFCNETEWGDIGTIPIPADWTSKLNSAISCKDILDNGYSTGGDTYWVDPDGGSTDNAFQVYCDMTTDSGWWALVVTIWTTWWSGILNAAAATAQIPEPGVNVKKLSDDQIKA